MSFPAIRWSYTANEVLGRHLSSAQLAVLRTLCWLYNTDRGHTRKTDNCFPSVEEIARISGLKVSAVNDAKQKLKEAKLISWVRAPNYDRDNMKPNVYSISCPALEEQLIKNERQLEKERHASEGREPEMDESYVPPVNPGFLFYRPDPASLIAAFPTRLAEDEARWMVDALEFVSDNREDIPSRRNRDVLYELLRRANNEIPALDAVLKRVEESSANGRRINNRLKYLCKAVENMVKERGAKE